MCLAQGHNKAPRVVVNVSQDLTVLSLMFYYQATALPAIEIAVYIKLDYNFGIYKLYLWFSFNDE